MYLINGDLTPLIILNFNEVLPFIKNTFMKDYLAQYLLHHTHSENFETIPDANRVLQTTFDIYNMLTYTMNGEKLTIAINSLVNVLDPTSYSKDDLIESIQQLCYYFIVSERFSFANRTAVKVEIKDSNPYSVVITFSFSDHAIEYSYSKPYYKRKISPKYLKYRNYSPVVSTTAAGKVVNDFCYYLREHSSVSIPFECDSEFRIAATFRNSNQALVCCHSS